MRFRRFVSLFVLLVSILALTTSSVGGQEADTEVSFDDACSSLIDISNLVIIDAKVVEGNAETYCKVQGITGSIHYAVKLPLMEEWDGRFLMLGDGGFGGSLASIDRPDRVGFAVASSDTGHSNVNRPRLHFRVE